MLCLEIPPAGWRLASGVGLLKVAGGRGCRYRKCRPGAGAPISLASPLVRLGGLVLASVVGLTALGEPFTWRFGVGALLCTGPVRRKSDYSSRQRLLF